MSLRTSAHTGVAIRIPAGKGNDKCAFGRIRSIFSYSPKALLSAMLCCKENGLPRRCAPRNDMLKFAAYQRLQGRSPSGKTRNRLPVCLEAPPCIRWRVPVFCMSLRTSAHTGVAIRFPCGNTKQIAALKANLQLLRVCPKYYWLAKYFCREADCHVAALLAMTCRDLPGACVCKDVLPRANS